MSRKFAPYLMFALGNPNRKKARTLWKLHCSWLAVEIDTLIIPDTFSQRMVLLTTLMATHSGGCGVLSVDMLVVTWPQVPTDLVKGNYLPFFIVVGQGYYSRVFTFQTRSMLWTTEIKKREIFVISGQNIFLHLHVEISFWITMLLFN